MMDHLPFEQSRFSLSSPTLSGAIVLLITASSAGMLVALSDTRLGFIFIGVSVALFAALLAVTKRGVGTALVLTLAASVSLGYTYPLPVGPLPPIQASFFVAFACLISLLLISGRRMPGGRTASGAPLLPQFTVYILALALSVITAVVPALGFTYLGHALIHALAFYVGLFCLARRSRLRAFTTVLILGGVISSLLGWIQRFWPDRFMIVYTAWNPVPAVIIELAAQILYWGRSTSIWANPSGLSTFMNITWPLALGMMLISSSRHRKIVLGLSLAILYSGLVIAGVRTDFVGLLLGASFLAIRLRGRSLPARYLVLGGLLVLALLLLIKPMGIISENLYSRLRFKNPWDVANAFGRVTIVQEHWRQFAQSPLTGVGLRNSEIVSNQSLGSLLEQGVSPHNYYSGMLAETGIVGFLAVIWLLVSSFRLEAKASLQTHPLEDQITITALVTSNVILLVTSLAQNPLLAWQFGLLFWLLRGSAVGLRLQSSDNTSQRR